MNTKRCKTCQQDLPLSAFHKHPQGAQGVIAHCRTCYLAARKAAYTPELAAKKKAWLKKARTEKREDKTIEQRFWPKVDKGDGKGCWNWTGAKRWMGHGGIWYRGENHMAHRVSLILHGVDVPADMFVDHICRNTSCVRPEHLRVVPPRVNSLENSLSPFAMNARKQKCSKCGTDLNGPGAAVLLVPVKKTHRGHPTNRKSRNRVCMNCYPSAANSMYRVDKSPSTNSSEKT